ncbi:hypothetical protein FGB62_33g017 [Gracilaria domingensis]|nr:hypothetical protein FGB62_33g017 [Gracilaria domingensis]
MWSDVRCDGSCGTMKSSFTFIKTNKYERVGMVVFSVSGDSGGLLLRATSFESLALNTRYESRVKWLSICVMRILLQLPCSTMWRMIVVVKDLNVRVPGCEGGWNAAARLRGSLAVVELVGGARRLPVRGFLGRVVVLNGNGLAAKCLNISSRKVGSGTLSLSLARRLLAARSAKRGRRERMKLTGGTRAWCVVSVSVRGWSVRGDGAMGWNQLLK